MSLVIAVLVTAIHAIAKYLLKTLMTATSGTSAVMTRYGDHGYSVVMTRLVLNKRQRDGSWSASQASDAA
jgi:hypothetical protein